MTVNTALAFSSSSADTSAKVRSRGLLATGVLAGAATGAVNLTVYAVGKAVGVPLDVDMGGTTQAVPVVMPFVASFVALFGGALLLKLLGRSRRGITAWTGIAAVVFAVYTAFALASATSASTGWLLTGMHVIVLATALATVVPAAGRSLDRP